MRVEQEEGKLLRGKFRLARNGLERGDIGACLLLVARHQMTAGTPALREVCATTGIGGNSCRRIQARSNSKQDRKMSHVPVVPP